MTDSSLRLFLAINLPADVRLEVLAAGAALRACAPELAWVDEPQLHLTLKFFGEQPAGRLDEIKQAVAHVAGRHRELVLKVGGVGAFPNFRRARVVWMGIDDEARLELLHHDVEAVCEPLGFDVEGRPFRPHLTLARVKQPLDEERLRQLARAAKQIDFQSEFIVRSIDLMESRLTPGGARYATLVSAALRSD